MVRERKKIRVASNKMRRDCAMCALSGGEMSEWLVTADMYPYVPKRTIDAENAAINVPYPLSFIIPYTIGTVRLPRIAGRARIPI